MAAERWVHARGAQESLADAEGEGWVFARAGQQMRSTNLCAAKKLLLCQVIARQGTATKEQVCGLFAQPLGEAETLAREEEARS